LLRFEIPPATCRRALKSVAMNQCQSAPFGRTLPRKKEKF